MEHKDTTETRMSELQEEAIGLISRMTDEQLEYLLQTLFPGTR